MSHQSSTNVTERPIIFSGPMVNAILGDKKFQTRRVLKGSTEFKGPYNPAYLEAHRGSPGWARICPYGQPGDRLWVRESCAQVHPCQVAQGRFSISGEPGIPGPPPVTYQVIYRADGEYPRVHFSSHEYPYRVVCSGENCQKSHTHPEEKWHGWTPSIHMPRKYSRILLEITQVRVERVQEISHRDALAEGVDYDVSKPDGSPLSRFQQLWDSINSKRGFGWEANPWVWAISFKRVQP